MTEPTTHSIVLKASELDDPATSGALSAQLAGLKSQVCLAMPSTNLKQAQQTAKTLGQRAGLPALVVVVKDDLDNGPAHILNRLFQLNPAPLYGYLAQDIFPGRHWLSRAVGVMRQSKAGLVAFNDGKWAGQIASYGLVQTAWAKKIYGDSLFFRGYRQHFGDVELSLIAQQHKVYGYDPHAVLLETDPDKDAKPVNAHDRELFASRKLNGFEGRVTDITLLGRFG